MNANSSEGNSALLAAAGSLEDSLNQMLQIFADYENIPDGGTVSVNKEFGGNAPKGTTTELIDSASKGLTSKELYVNEMIRRGVYNDDTDVKEELQRLNAIAID